MTKEKTQDQGPNLVTDDFEWSPPEPDSSAAQDAARSTELDRIEFEDPVPGKALPQPVPSPAEPQPSPPPEVKKRQWRLPLFLTPKLLILGGTGLGVIVVICGVLLHFLLGTSSATYTNAITSSIYQNHGEQADLSLENRVLSNFLLPQEEEKGTFTSYTILIKINRTVFDYYLAQEGQVRAEIFETLKDMQQKKLGENFSQAAAERVNKRLKAKVLITAEIESSETI